MKKNPPQSRLSAAPVDAPIDDVIQAIKDDHKDLKRFIRVMKSEDATPAKIKEAAQFFMSLLKSHAPSEEKALYNRCIRVPKLRVMTDEGFVEHGIADRLMEKIASTRNSDRWLAEVKVLAELVEHHIEEEEEDFLPKVKKHFSKTKQTEMAHEFFALRKKSQRGITEKNAGVLKAL